MVSRPGWQGKTEKRIVNHSPEFRLSPKDNGKQGSDSEIADGSILHRVGGQPEDGPSW